MEGDANKIDVICIPHAYLIIMLVRTHMDIHLVSVGYYCMQQYAVRSRTGLVNWWKSQDWVETSVLFDNDI